MGHRGVANGKFGRRVEQMVTHMYDLTPLSNDTLLRAYEDIRTNVMMDVRSGGTYRFMGQAAKERADLLLAEIRRRGLSVPTITW